jgi:hypothetical protein
MKFTQVCVIDVMRLLIAFEVTLWYFLITSAPNFLFALRIEQLFELFFVFHKKSECESLTLVVTPKKIPKPYKNTKPRNIEVSGFFDKKLLPL